LLKYLQRWNGYSYTIKGRRNILNLYNINQNGNRDTSYSTLSYSESQIAVVKSILSKYEPENITQKDAREIMTAFRKSGLTPGDDLREAVKNEGFDYKELRTLTKGTGNKHKNDPSEPEENNDESVSEKLDISSLQALKSILSQYDLSTLDPTLESEILAKIGSAGLLEADNMIDISA
jgi:hypothetical protein